MFSQLSDLNALLPSIYLFASILVGVCVIIEASLLANNDGKIPAGQAFVLVSIISTAWTLISGLAWFFLDFELLGSVAAFIYPLYSIMGLIYSARLMRGVDLPDDPMEIALPIKYLQYCRSFGIAYTALCLMAIVELFGYIPL